MVDKKDKAIIRELAAQTAEIAALPAQEEMECMALSSASDLM